ncbi:MAG: elongation factor G [Candidatus Doudnabacteria bacterium]|nr:elongation factor G [Candidatus Doudnabacteria bacterium]
MATTTDYSTVKDQKYYRNIGIIAHIDAGKTTTSERILFYTGKKHKLGEVHEGEATMDFMDQERERGITIQSAATTAFWDVDGQKYRINLIDTPGHVDFTAEVERSLRVLDGAVVVFDGKQGVEPQSSTVWLQAEKYNVPRICYVNKLDGIGADFFMSYDTIIDQLNDKAVPIQLPIGIESDFNGIIDLVTMTADFYKDEKGLQIEHGDIPADLKAKAEEWRGKLLEAVADADDNIAEKYLGGEDISVEELRAAIRKAVIANKLFPVIAGASLRNRGVQQMLNAICHYLPSPHDKIFVNHNDAGEVDATYVGEVPGTDPRAEGVITRKLSEEEPFAGLVFKIAVDPHVGTLAFFRVYSGKLTAGSYVYNSTVGTKERVGRILMMHADHREDIAEVKAGDIAAIVGLKGTQTGHTICDEGKQIILESIKFPEPVVSFAIEPKTKSDQDKLGTALAKLTSEDPTFRVKTDEETAQTIISGMGELHLDIKVDILKRTYGIEVNVGKPQVAYRETITAAGEHRELLKKQTGGAGQFADITFNLEPRERGAGYEFVNDIKGGAIPKEYIPAIDKGIVESMTAGPLGGFPVVDITAHITDGSYHDVDSNTDTFKMCAIYGFKEAMKKCKPVLLEPMMKVSVTVPEEFVGAVTGYLSSHRGIPKGLTQRGKMKEITAEAPLAEMFGYVSDLRNLTSGKAIPNMQFSHYAEVPGGIMKQVLGEE